MLELTSMATLLDLSWVVPATPLGGAILIAALLLSFNTTINRLTKPISFVLISCVALSTILSGLMLLNHASGESFQMDLGISFYLDDLVEKTLIVIGSIFLIAMILSYYILDRQKGYVRYMIALSFLCGLIYSSILNSYSFRFILEKLSF